MTVYIGGQSFTLYDCAYMHNYIFIANPTNVLPGCCILSRELLITCYKKTIQKVIP